MWVFRWGLGREERWVWMAERRMWPAEWKVCWWGGGLPSEARRMGRGISCSWFWGGLLEGFLMFDF